MLDPIALDYIDYIQPYLKLVSNWKLHYCIVPRVCILTNKWLWFEHCYVGSRVIIAPGHQMTERYYIEKNEFLLWCLRK